MGENPKMPYPPCGRSIKTYARGNNDAPSIAKYGSLVRLDAQIVALRLHCAKGATNGGMFARRAPGALPFYQLSRLQPEIYPLIEKAPQIDHDGLRTFPTKHVA